MSDVLTLACTYVDNNGKSITQTSMRLVPSSYCCSELLKSFQAHSKEAMMDGRSIKNMAHRSLERFPYGVFYLAEKDRIVVIAVMDCRTFQIVCAVCKEPVFKVSRGSENNELLPWEEKMFVYIKRFFNTQNEKRRMSIMESMGKHELISPYSHQEADLFTMFGSHVIYNAFGILLRIPYLQLLKRAVKSE